MENTRYNRPQLIRTFLAISIGLFLFSLTRDCFCTENSCADSIIVLLTGWAGVVLSGAGITWLANPLLILSWILTKRDSKYAIASSFFSTALCFSFLLFHKIVDNEGGGSSVITEYKLGYWLWSTSALTMLVGNIIMEYKLPRKNVL